MKWKKYKSIGNKNVAYNFWFIGKIIEINTINR